MKQDNLPVALMIKTLERLVAESGISYREIERRALALGYDINLWKILSVSKTDTQRIKILSTIDSYVEPILDVLEYSPKEFAQRMAAEAEGKRLKKRDSWINPDIREFMDNPEARPYIELAYMNYQKDKLEERSKEIEKQINKKK